MTEYRFGDICKVINGRAYRQPELLDAGKYPVLRVGNFFSSDRWFYSDLELPEDKYCDNGDLLFAWSASFGPRIWDEGKVIYHYHIWKLEPNEAIVDKYYLYYWLRKSVDILTAGTHGSVMAHMTKGDMENQRIFLPCIEEQRKVGKTLRLLDDKIKINSKINDNLQQQAAALFANFYDRAETEVGFTEMIQILGGGTPKTGESSYWNGNVPFFTPKDVGLPYTITTEKTITEEGLAHCNSRLYPINTVFVTARGTVGKVGLSGVPMAMNQSCYALVGKDTHQLLVYFYTLEAVDRLKHKASGAVFDAITTRDFESEIIMKLSDDDAKDFLDVAGPIYQAVLNNSIENLRLAALRDSLLPKLMSGEIDVSKINCDLQ